MTLRCCWILAPLLVLAASLQAKVAAKDPDGSAPNHVFQKLLESGVDVGGEQYVLPPPVLADGASESEKLPAVKKLCVGVTFDQFAAREVNAPDITPRPKDLKKNDQGAVRQVDNYFIAFGDAQLLRDKEFLNSLAKGNEGEGNAEGKVLTAEDLAKRGIAPPTTEQETIAFGVFSLLEKMRMSAVSHAMWSGGDESLVLAGYVDDRFKDDKEYPNQWKSLRRLDTGKWQEGEPHPYSGAAFYTKFTKFEVPEKAGKSGPAAAFFVETHLVFFEPRGWFQGAPTLTSKFSLIAENRAKDLRRKLLRASASR